jgi:peptide/nickel transport system permease protein
MLLYASRRLIELALVLAGVSVVVFSVIRLVPGDAVAIMLGANVEITPDRMEALRRSIGLDKPFWVQYADWIGGVLRGDFGVSVFTGRPVAEELAGRLPITIELTLLALVVAALVAIPLGIVAASQRGSWADTITRTVTIAGLSIPGFWLGTLLLLGAAAFIPGFRALGWVRFTDDPVGHLERLILPLITLTLPMIAGLSRLVRSSLLEVLGADYIRTARAKGVAGWIVLWRHALRNAMIPVVTAMGIQAGYLFGGAIIVEEIFAIPGVGRLVIGAVSQRNYPLVQGTVLLITAAFVIINLIVDLAYALIDPRVRYES